MSLSIIIYYWDSMSTLCSKINRLWAYCRLLCRFNDERCHFSKTNLGNSLETCLLLFVRKIMIFFLILIKKNFKLLYLNMCKLIMLLFWYTMTQKLCMILYSIYIIINYIFHEYYHSDYLKLNWVIWGVNFTNISGYIFFSLYK